MIHLELSLSPARRLYDLFSSLKGGNFLSKKDMCILLEGDLVGLKKVGCSLLGLGSTIDKV